MTVPTGYSMPVPPPPKRSKTLRNVLIIVGIVLALCCAAAAFGGYSLFNAAGPVKSAAEDFVSDLESGNTSAAYQRLCESTQDAYTLEAFTTGVAQQPKITSHQFVGFSVNNRNGVNGGTVSFRLTLAGGSVVQHTIPLAEEDGSWKVCGDPY